ncbi:MAG TPA: DNA polymerase, partial [Chloroflexia bacterium]
MPAVPSPAPAPPPADDWLFGWDPTPGIVSVWADRAGRALVWQRGAGGVTCAAARFRPWLWAATLDDLAHLGPALVPVDAPGAADAPVCYRPLADATTGTYRYLLSARDGPTLERTILTGATRR